MEHTQRLASEIQDMLRGSGRMQPVFEGAGNFVDPPQSRGIETHPGAEVITELPRNIL